MQEEEEDARFSEACLAELDNAEEEFVIRLVDSDPRLAPFRFRVVIFSARLELELECVEVTEDNW